MICPACCGRRKVMAFVNRGEDIETHSCEMIDCLVCHGSGEIADEHAARIATGRHLRDARVARRESLLAAARRLGMTPSELSGIETGRLPCPPSLLS